jgi:tetratricopeptide (TPR) repeat protein
MSANSVSSKESPSSVCTTLFCLRDAPPSSQDHPEAADRFQESFSRLLPLLNVSSTCYFIAQEPPSERMLFEGLLDEVSSFLETNEFLQVSMRPVHPFAGKDAEAWVAAYLRFLRACKPFQEEGYREQIIARLRIFPVLYLKDAAALVEARPFLVFLQESFFLPSILMPLPAIDEVAALSGREHELPWVRVYVTDSSAFDSRRTLELVHAHEIFDKVLEGDASAFPEGKDLPCAEMMILESSGTVRACPRRGRMNVPVEQPACTECLLSTMALTGLSYRIHPQGASAWHQLCDRMATRFVRNGDHGEAIQVWHASAQAYPPESVPPSLLLHIALCHYEEGDLDEAMDLLREAQQGDPRSADIRYYMGKCEFGWKDYIEAADRFQEAIHLGLPRRLYVEAQYYRGLSHYHIEEYDEALEPLAEAERAGMEGSPLPFYQGLCFLGKQQPGLALPYLQEALSRGPSSEDLFHVLFYIAHTYKEMGDFVSALDYCEKADEIQPGSYELWNLKGFCHFKQRNHDEAIACFQRAIEIDPASAIDYANIGSNLRDKGDVEGAVTMYRKALSLDPSIEFARDNLKRLQGSPTHDS